MNIATIAFRNLSRNRRRSILSLSAIAVTAIVMVFMMGLIAWMKDDIRGNITTYIAGDLRIRHGEFTDEEDGNPLEFLVEDLSDVIRKVTAVPGVTAVSPRLHLGTAAYRDGRTVPAVGMAVDFALEEGFIGLSGFLTEGRLPQTGAREAVFSRPLAEKLGIGNGDRITLLFTTRRRSSNAVTLTVSGIAEFDGVSVNQETFFAPLELMQRIVHTGDAAMELLIRTDVDNADLRALGGKAEEIAAALPPDSPLKVSAWNEASDFWSLIQFADLTYGVMAAVFFILGSTVIINTTIMTIYERRKEIGTLGALGMEPGQIVRLFFAEATFLGIIGAAAGTILGFLLSLPVMRTGIPLYDSFMTEFGAEFSTRLYILVRPGTLLYVFVFASVIASIASYLPARRSSRVAPVEALREE
jgi:putative ABC transport system permease protein